MKTGELFEFKGIIGVENGKLLQGLFINADTNEPVVFCMPKKQVKKSKKINVMTNKQKATIIANQCMPCTNDFYNGIYQGVLLTLVCEKSL